MRSSRSSRLDQAAGALSNATTNVPRETQPPVVDSLIEQGQSEGVQIVKDTAVEMFSVLKSQLGTFIQSSQGLTKVLDEAGKLHPFISGVALTLELKRRDNDKKVLTLFVKMTEMMDQLRLLNDIQPSMLGPQGRTLEERMNSHINGAAVAIEECSHATHEYYKTKFIPKLIKCIKWEEKFANFISTFATLEIKFKEQLQMYTAHGVQAIDITVKGIDEKMNHLMKIVFTKLLSPEEHELISFMNTKGGPEKFISDEKLLLELVQKSDAQAYRSQSALPLPGLFGRKEPDAFQNFADIQEELKTDLNTALDDSRKSFEVLFKEQRNQIEQLKNVVIRESDRVVERILAGPHSRILDKVIYLIWVEMGWKASAKSRHFTMALREFYADQFQQAELQSQLDSDSKSVTITVQRRTTQDTRKTETTTIIPHISKEDSWAVDYITGFQLRPLLEALDPDYSGFVTINEINAFTSERPQDWSLPQWLAYWAVGFRITLRRCCYRIRALFTELNSLYSSLIPGNAGVFSSFIQRPELTTIDALIAGVYTLESQDHIDEYQHPSFQQYVWSNEQRIGKLLDDFEYIVEDQTTLSLLAKGGRLESHIFPLVLALLRYSAQLLRQGEIRLLDQSEFSNIIISLRTILFAVKDRIDSLIGIFKLRNIPIQDELRKYCHGMYFDEMDRENSYYNMPETDVDAPDADENMELDNLEIVIASRCQRLCTDDYDVLDVSGYEVTMPSSSGSVASVFRPSDEQPITNRPHALWKVAIAATLSRVTAGHISWWILKRRRDQRLRFIELLHQREWEGFRKASQWKEFQALRQGLSLADLRFYRSLARVYTGREIFHHYKCDVCSRDKNRMTRYICLDCSKGYSYNTIDLCRNCISCSFTASRDKEIEHTPAHSLLQIRRPLTFRQTHSCREKASTTLKENHLTKEGDGLHCNSCNVKVQEPYWLCCDCFDFVMCMDCNNKVEKARPWLYSRRPNAEDSNVDSNIVATTKHATEAITTSVMMTSDTKDCNLHQVERISVLANNSSNSATCIPVTTATFSSVMAPRHAVVEPVISGVAYPVSVNVEDRNENRVQNPVSHQTTRIENSAARIQESASLTVEDKAENRVQNSISHQATGTVYESVITGSVVECGSVLPQCLGSREKPEESSPLDLLPSNPERNNNPFKKVNASLIFKSVLPPRLESGEKLGEGSPIDLLPSNPEGCSNPFEEDEKTDIAPQRNNSDTAHHWSHDMVLCTNSDVPVMKKTLDERLASLEQKLGTQEFLMDISTQTLQIRLEALESQLQEMEKLLRILVEGKP
ncbi:hypothetical protein M422DRAFT_784182 [Sphaerobolus stellatus SS14]|uniref:ZZ-type domain-containing protein n=1 Tax=Sphaerobolus stellatus (strain SS14) TaxID=990650 RepID=A0A0C9UXH8_SPHS4|nr:hypothetical protein M422DRAFT_784182 [Sphaerobolus stellatus SS14]